MATFTRPTVRPRRCPSPQFPPAKYGIKSCRLSPPGILTSSKPAFRWGTCVGRHFPGIEWKVIRITDEPIATIERPKNCPPAKLASSSSAARRHDRICHAQPSGTASKIRDGETFWHRMGDVGYLEKVLTAGLDLICMCNLQRLQGPAGSRAYSVLVLRPQIPPCHHCPGTLFTIPCEAIFNRHPWVYRSALVGAGPRGQQTLRHIRRSVARTSPYGPAERRPAHRGVAQLGRQHSPHRQINHFVFLRGTLPVDIRHNAKIFREKLVPPPNHIQTIALAGTKVRPGELVRRLLSHRTRFGPS